MSDIKPVAWQRFDEIGEYDTYMGLVEEGDYVKYDDALAIVTALQAEIEALRKDAVDAARWRALQKDRRTEIWTTGLHAYVDDAGLDEQADAAIAKEKQQESLK